MGNQMIFATLCYVRQGDSTLMIHRVKKDRDMHLGKWNGLGGKLFPGESPEDCAIREVFEESGLRVISLKLKGVLTFPQFQLGEDWYAFVFVINKFDGELIDSPEGHLCWIKNGDLMDLNLWEGDRIFLPWLEEPGIFSAKFYYSEGKLMDYVVNHYCSAQ
jgi:8-oxo-dGTP diphosphatase